jgi:hypothetical protein
MIRCALSFRCNEPCNSVGLEDSKEMMSGCCSDDSDGGIGLVMCIRNFESFRFLCTGT